jgi:hypothetical protein
MPVRAPIAPGLFEVIDGRPRLLGARRKADGVIVFPRPGAAEAELYEPCVLGARGRLWSYTVQRFRPKSPPYRGAESEAEFRPYALGYVEIPSETIVESRLIVSDFSSLRIGLPMRLTLVPFKTAGGGETAMFAFEPDEEAA